MFKKFLKIFFQSLYSQVEAINTPSFAKSKLWVFPYMASSISGNKGLSNLFRFAVFISFIAENPRSQHALSRSNVKANEKLAQYSHILQCEVQISAWLQCSDIVRNSRGEILLLVGDILGPNFFTCPTFGPSAQISVAGPNFGPSEIAAQILAQLGPKRNTVDE